MKAIVAALVIGGMFGSASATVQSSDGDVMVVDLEVEVLASGEAVVAHLVFDNEPELTFPLLDRGGGVFGITTELGIKNYVVVFEVVGPEGGSSDPVTLSQLGVDLTPAQGATTTVPEEGLTRESRALLWLAIALGAASLSLLAFWALGGGRGGRGRHAGATGSDNGSDGAEEE